jgi:hypothetical protein
MRILHMLVVTLLIVSLATIAAAQTTGLIPGFIPNGADVAAPPADAPKIDPSRVKFLLRTGCEENLEYSPGVNGVVDQAIDLSDELKAKQLLQMGIAFWQEKCPSFSLRVNGFYSQVDVYLRWGDPVAFTDVGEGFGFLKGNIYGYPLDLVSGGLSYKKPGLIVGYRNFQRAFKNQQAYYAEQERQRNAALEQQRQAEQRVAASWAAFAKAHRVKQIVTIDQLTANPFVYQGQVVAISCIFEKMNSATQGIFSVGGDMFLVSGISSSRFRVRSPVVLAGRVLGNIEVRPGPTLVPHLSFVGIWVAG